MMETQKNDKRRPIPSCLGCFGITFFLCFGIFGALVLLMPFIAKIRQTELAPEFVPTAEVLLDTPHEIELDNFSLYLIVMENYGQVLGSSSENNDVICITIPTDSPNLNHSALYIDGVWVLGATDIFILTNDDLGSPPRSQWCAYGELQSGIHLIEFHLKESFWGEPIHIQQWAIEIE